MAIKVREAQLVDVWDIIEMVCEFREHQKELGVKTIAKDRQVLKGGTALEVGLTFRDPQWKYIVAERDGELIGFMVGCIEKCGPTSEYESCMRVHGDYLKDKTLGNPRVLQKMWDLLLKWGHEKGADYYFGMIHPGNQPSIKTAKFAGLKHHMTEFIGFYKRGE
jgi:hypothetical protein